MPPKTPKHPCGTCGKSAATNSVLCNFCDMWHHATPECMIGLTKEAIDAILPLCKDQSCWSCNKCSHVLKMLKGRLATLEKDVSTVKTEIATVKNKQGETDKSVSELTTQVQGLSKKVDDNTSNTKSSVMSEMKNREMRKNNLIVLGLNEPSTVTGESRDSVMKKEDVLLDKVVTELKLNIDEVKSKIKYRKRLGEKKADYQRPLLLSFKDQSMRDTVMNQSFELNDGPMNNIRLRPDLTAMEREEDKALRIETDKLNTQSPSDNQGNFRWKVVGPPGRLRRMKERDLEKWKQDQQKRTRWLTPNINNSASGTAMLEVGLTNTDNNIFKVLETITEENGETEGPA